MKIAVLGPGGVGGLMAAVLDRAGAAVTVVARSSTAGELRRRGLLLESVRFGEFVAHPRALERLEEPVDALIVATKAAGLQSGLERIVVEPRLVLPLLNGLDHIALLRERFAADSVLAGAIRVESDRPAPGVVVHTSPFLLIEMAARQAGHPDALEREDVQALAQALDQAGVPVHLLDSEAQVMWSKLVRLNALACTTSAYDKLLGEIRSTPELRADLLGAMQEGAAVGRAEGAEVDPATAMAELEQAHDTLGSSMQRDIAAGREPEVDAIPGSVLRAAARHGLQCPTITRLVALIATRAGLPTPAFGR